MTGLAAPDFSSGAAISACGNGSASFVLRLQDALLSAYMGQPQVISSREDVEKAKANLLSAETPFLPAATASLQGEHFVSRTPLGGTATVGSSVVGGQDDRYSTYPSIGLTWNLFSGGKDLAGYRGAQASLRASEHDLSGEINDVLVSVLSAYTDLVKAQASVSEQTEAVGLQQQILARGEQRYQRGRSSLIAVNQAKVSLAQNQRDLLQACQTLFEKSSGLAQAVGMRLGGAVLVAAEPVPEVSNVKWNEEKPDTVVEDDSKVKAAKERVEAAQKKVDQARAAFYPTLSLTGRYDWLGQSGSSLANAYHATAANSYRVGFVVQQPLGSFTSEYATLQSAQADLAKAQASYEQAFINTEAKLRNALSARIKADLAAKSAVASAGDAEHTVKLSGQLFSRGMADRDTVAQAEITAGKEQEKAYELAMDARLSDWLAWRVLHPAKFAPALMKQIQADWAVEVARHAEARDAAVIMHP